jgi:hypothetical protein
MANGLFNTQNNAARVMLQMEAERAKRIRDAGAGMDPIVAAMARAQAGMRESVGDLSRAGAGLFGMKMPQDPRLSQAMKRDKDRNEMMQMLQGFAADGNITEDEVKIGYTQLMRRGYMQEAREFLQQAASMGTMRRAEAGEKRAEAGEKRAEEGLQLRKEAGERAVEGLGLQRKAGERAQIASEIAQKKAEADREMDPLRKQELQEKIKLLQERRVQLGKSKSPTGFKLLTVRESKRVADLIYNDKFRKRYETMYKDKLGTFGGGVDRKKLEKFQGDLAQLRTDPRYKSLGTEALMDVLLSGQTRTSTSTNTRTKEPVPIIKRQGD